MPPADAVTSRLAARRVRFDWSSTPLHWVPGDAQTTHTANVLHLLLPAGERWFVDVYRQALPAVTDPRLRADVKAFMGQESTHSRAHAGVLDHLAAQGIDATRYTTKVERLFDQVLGDEPWGRPVPERLRARWLRQRLAIIAAIEHFTAVLGTWVLEAEGFDAAGADPVMVDLLRWHGAEEVEHRAVAFDLYQHLDGGYLRRVAAMVQVAPVLVGLWVAGISFLLREDPTTAEAPTLRAYWRAARKDRLPGPVRLMSAVPRYLRRGYHPSHEGSTARARAYLAVSPAVAGGEAARP